MKIKAGVILFALLSLMSFTSRASMMTCPNPQTSTLKNGKAPPPWEINPIADFLPTVDKETQFARADILVSGVRVFGVVCYYRSMGLVYSIWWPVQVGRPAQSSNWGDIPSGYRCSEDSVKQCQFNVLAN